MSVFTSFLPFYESGGDEERLPFRPGELSPEGFQVQAYVGGLFSGGEAVGDGYGHEVDGFVGFFQCGFPFVFGV